MLEEIIKNNLEFEKFPPIIPILKQIETFIPENVRSNFYRNLQSLKVELIYDGETSYIFKENKIIIDKNTEKYLLGENWNDEAKKIANENILIGNLCHELMHMASTNYSEELNLINTGFESIIPKTEDNSEEKILNNFLNEGFTDLFTIILYPNSYTFSGYKDIVNIAGVITSLVGLDNIKSLYFSNGLAIRLKKIMTFTDEGKVSTMFEKLENGNMAKLLSIYTKNNLYMEGYYKNLSDAFIVLLDIVKDGLLCGLQNEIFNTKEELDNFYFQQIKPYLENLLYSLETNPSENLINNIDLNNLTVNLIKDYDLTDKTHNLGFITILSLITIFAILIIGILIAFLILN